NAVTSRSIGKSRTAFQPKSSASQCGVTTRSSNGCWPSEPAIRASGRSGRRPRTTRRVRIVQANPTTKPRSRPTRLYRSRKSGHEERTSIMTDKINIAPCLWFNKNAEDAARFYAATFPNSGVIAVHKAPSDYPSGKAGDVLTVDFTVLGQHFVGL